MLFGAGKLNKYLNSWLEEHGFECTVEFDLDFTYDQLNNIIHYTLIVPLDHDEMFMKVCQEYREELIDVDCFLLSFFHEIGHWVTEDMWSPEEWDEYDKYVESLPSPMTDENFNDYYHYPIEWEATRWACDFMVNNEQLVKNFWEELQPLIMEFYEKNEVELDDVSI